MNSVFENFYDEEDMREQRLKYMDKYSYDENWDEEPQYLLSSEDVDEDLEEYFIEARLIPKKDKKVKKKTFKFGDKVNVNGKRASIIYGPFDQNGKKVYEVELDGEVTTVNANDING